MARPNVLPFVRLTASALEIKMAIVVQYLDYIFSTDALPHIAARIVFRWKRIWQGRNLSPYKSAFRAVVRCILLSQPLCRNQGQAL